MSARLRRLVSSRRARWSAVGITVLVAAVNTTQTPLDTRWLPLLLGLLPYLVGKYVACPLRWHALSASGRPRRWHVRAYAEAELLGFLSPAHAGADLWRIHRLHGLGLDRASAAAEVGLDRLIGAVALAGFVALTGVALPPQLLVVALVGAAALAVGAWVLRRWRPARLPRCRRPSRRVLASGLLLSGLYQLSSFGLLLAAVDAIGHPLNPMTLLGIFGASQVAAIVPGVQGAGPREGALVAGLVAVGLPVHAALHAVSLAAGIVWLPALAFGGGCHLLRLWTDRTARRSNAMPTLSGAAL